MVLSGHAVTRCKQRGISQEVCDFVYRFGEAQQASGGRLMITFSKRCKSEIEELIARATNRTIVVDGSGTVITAYFNGQKRRKR